jgi:hypothetical protein
MEKREGEIRVDQREGSVIQILGTVTYYNSGLLNLLCGVANFGKTWSACGQRGIKHTGWRLNS